MSDPLMEPSNDQFMTLEGLESPIQFDRAPLSSPLSKFGIKPLDAQAKKGSGAKKTRGKKQQGLVLDADTSLTNAEIRAMQSGSTEPLLTTPSVGCDCKRS
jgi:hypothetical protein